MTHVGNIHDGMQRAIVIVDDSSGVSDETLQHAYMSKGDPVFELSYDFTLDMFACSRVSSETLELSSTIAIACICIPP